MALKSPVSSMGLFLFLRARRKPSLRNLPVFSLIEPFLPKNKFFNFFVIRAEKLRTFAPYLKTTQISEND